MSTNWHSNPGGARTNNWNPTPPASPNNWSNAGGTTGWSSSNQGSGWAQPSEDALWSAAPGISTGPVRRGRSNSDSWGSAPPKGDSWEAVPGWSARPENNTGWSGATQPVYAQSGTQGTSWNNSARSNDSWSNAGAPGGGPNNNSTNSRWAPAGWDPLPPPKFGPGVGSVTGISPAPTVLSNWDAKRPSVDRTPAPKVAASTPAAPAPTVPAPAAPATPVGEKAVSFEVSEETVDKDPRGRDSSRPGRGRGAAAGGTYYTRDNRNATQNSALRKTKSAGGLDRKYRPDGKRGGGVNGDSMARGDSLNRGQAGGQQMQKINKRKTESPSGPPGTGKPSGRLFTRQLDEVNRSLGVGKEGAAPTPGDGKHRKVALDPSRALGVYIYGFPQGVQVKQFIDIFGEFGTIVNVSLVGKPKRHERAYAYVDYENAGSAAKAVEALKTKKFFEMPRPLELRLSFSNPNAPLVSAAAPVNSSDKPAGGSEGRKQSDGKVAAAAAAVAAVAAAAAAAKEAKEAKDAKKAPAGTKEKEKEKEKKFEDKDAVDLRTIHLANLPQNIDKSDVEKVFGIHGDIRRIQIVQKPKDKRVYAFVSFRDEVSCRKALASIKDALYFDMTEALKAEYAKQQNPDKKRKAIDKPWKKGEALEKRDRNDRKREGGQDKATDKRAEKQGGGEQRRKSSTTLQRTVIFISSVPTEFASIEALQGKLGEFGNILSIYVVSRHDPASTAQFALVTFEKAEDASKVIAAKVLTCVFPRQRRVVVRGIPESATEEEVKAFFVVLGDIRRVEKFEKDGGDNGWMIEFVRPESAARTLVKAVEDKFGEAVIKAEYAPSTNKTNAAANAAATDAAASDEKGAEDDEDDEAAEADEEAPVEQLDDDESSSEDEEAAIVVEEEEVVVEAKEQ